MTADELLASAEPPEGAGGPLRALWWAARGDWDRAHEEAQAAKDRDGDWVHAHLHREEGDLGNADYWYRRAGRPRPDVPLAEERRAITAALLAARPA